MRLGSADLPDMPLAARLEATPDKGDLAGAVARIEQHLREHPEDGRGFEVVAPYYLRSGRGEEAIEAYAEALRLLGPTAERHASLGQARMIVARGAVTAEARKDFEAALALDPGNPMAQYYLGVAAAQAGEKENAIEIFARMAADAPAGRPLSLGGKAAARDAARRGAAGAHGPAGAVSAQGKAIAALPADAQTAAIRGHGRQARGAAWRKRRRCRGLASKLIRAYSVLAEPEKAQEGAAPTPARRSPARTRRRRASTRSPGN